jgi:hypothetical protein
MAKEYRNLGGMAAAQGRIPKIRGHLTGETGGRGGEDEQQPPFSLPITLFRNPRIGPQTRSTPLEVSSRRSVREGQPGRATTCM